MKVTLTPAEMVMAANVGVLRHVSSLKAGRSDRHGAAAGGWQLHIEGALGELAYSKAVGVFWPGSVNSFKGEDSAGGVQIRTRSKPEYELIVRDDDSDDDLFVLVVGTAPEYRVVGSIRGADAKRAEWRRAHGGREAAYFVPHGELN
jgi:hypothetical protein